MKGAKVRVEPKIIHTADVDAFATVSQRCCWSDNVSILFEPHHSRRTYSHFLSEMQRITNTDWEKYNHT